MTLEEAPKLEIEFNIPLFMEKNNLAIHLGTTEFYCTIHYFVDKDGNNVTLFLIDDNELIVINTTNSTTYCYMGESFNFPVYIHPFIAVVYTLSIGTNLLATVNSSVRNSIVLGDEETLRLLVTHTPINSVEDIISLTQVNDKLILVNGGKELYNEQFDNTDVLTWIKLVNNLSSNLED